jgi:DNA adenine methylase
LKEKTVSSFLKWAGSKRRIVNLLARFCPERIDRYFEPFLGSAALFLLLAQTRPRFKAILSDSNEELINVYTSIRDNVRDLTEVLLVHQANYYKNPEEYFYYIRNDYDALTSTERAARLILLNKTCYNGLYRVNKSGLFNVPHGTYVRPTICQVERLKAISEILNATDAEIFCDYYQNVTERCEPSDFVYFDPPYFPITKTASFKDYTAEDFNYTAHIALAREFERLSKIGCSVLLSNSNSPLIAGLYTNFHTFTVTIPRLINCNAQKRANHQELLISNKRILTKNASNTCAQNVR